MVWREFVTNVDMRPKNYSEEFHILSKDNLNVGFEAHARISLKDGSVQDVVESLGGGERAGASVQGALPEWYLRNVQRPYRAAVRDIVHQYDAYDIQSKTAEIGAHILERLQEEYGDTSIVFETMSIGNLSYPEAINQEIQRKLAAEQNLERKERERQIAEQEAQIMMTDARGRAAAQRIVNETLTDLYVQHEMITGFEALARSPRATIIAAPVGDSSASPVILSIGQ
jgi:regulator of protease activity HflC (stomatin/prohibitin superfamily)